MHAHQEWSIDNWFHFHPPGVYILHTLWRIVYSTAIPGDKYDNRQGDSSPSEVQPHSQTHKSVSIDSA